MSDLSDITTITINRTTQAVTRAAFGTPAIISEFDTGKTTVAFERHRFYISGAAMLTDGWSTVDPEYNAAVKIFAQTPRRVEQIMIGRIDSADANLGASLAAIQLANVNWYTFMIIGHNQAKTVFDADLVAANSIVFTVNGTAVTAVTFNGTHAQTMLDLETQIESDIANSVVTVLTANTDDPNNRTLLITVDGKAPTVDVVITLGASQAGDSSGVSTTKLIFDADLIAANSILVTVDGVAQDAVVFAGSHANTMALLVTEIEGGVTGAVCVITDDDATGRTIDVNVNGQEASVSAVVTLGASQAGATSTNNLTDNYTLAATWTETQKKIYFASSSLADILGSGSTDFASVIKTADRDRTAVLFHTSSQGDATPAHFEAAWPAEMLPYDPGSQTWAYKNLAELASYTLTPTQRVNLVAKFCNFYTETGGNDVAETGNVSSGEWIDIIRGIDWLDSRLEEDVFLGLLSVRKIPFTDEGVAVIVGIVKAALELAATREILVKDSIGVSAPLVADISTANKALRNLPDVTFAATLQGAIHLTDITGTVTV